MSETLEHQGDQAQHDELYRIRHSLAHVLAQAVLSLRPGLHRAFFGPRTGPRAAAV